jgi:hypothetical protein
VKTKPALRQLYALAHEIKKRANKKPVAKLWFEKAKEMLARSKE